MSRWADICCGSGALTLELLSHGRVQPPAAYLGGKRAYAADIIRLMGGYARPSSVVLCDAGPWGWWWHTVLVEGCGAAVADALDALAERPEQGADLHRALAAEGGTGPAERAAAFLAMQASAARGRPVLPDGRGWKTPGYAHLSNAARAKGFAERLRPRRLAARVRAILAIDWPPVTVVHGDAANAPLGAGRAVIDPPYQGTTGYGCDLTRPRVVALAERHAAAGALVGVCEAGPVADLPGWHAVRLRRDGWQRRLAPVRETLTLSAPPEPRQLPLMLAAPATHRSSACSGWASTSSDSATVTSCSASTPLV